MWRVSWAGWRAATRRPCPAPTCGSTPADRSVRAERVRPAKTWEAGEVAVGRGEHQAVLDGEGGEVRVRDEICLRDRRGQRGHHLAVAIGRCRYPGWRGVQPLLD